MNKENEFYIHQSILTTNPALHTSCGLDPCIIGRFVGDLEIGLAVGLCVGGAVGCVVGLGVGNLVGSRVGCLVG